MAARHRRRNRSEKARAHAPMVTRFVGRGRARGSRHARIRGNSEGWSRKHKETYMWIGVAVAAYFLYAVVALGDKYLLSGPLPSPKTYAFYVGVLGGGVVILLVVFRFVTIPETSILVFGLLAGVMRTLFLLALFHALRLFEASRIIPALGGILPLFLLLFVFLFAGDTAIFLPRNFLAFLLLVAGAVGISFMRDRRITSRSITAATVAAFFGALSFFFSKFVYDEQPFLSGLAWLLAGAFLMSLVFLAFREVRKEVSRIFQGHKNAMTSSPKKFPLWIFLGNQAAGTSAALLQNFAIALVPLGLLSFVSAIGGVQYLFLFAFALFLSRRFPLVLKEEVSRSIILQKAISIFLIAAGLVLLAL